MPFIDPTLNPFFAPQGVAVAGVSLNPAKLGYGIAQNLVNSGYPGAIHFVNPRGGKLFGRTIYTSIDQIPDPVDLVVILVPPKIVPATLQACGERGIRAAVIATGGFREVGPEGAKLEETCLDAYQAIIPRVTGRAYLTGFHQFVLDPDDPFPGGFSLTQSVVEGDP